MQLQEYEASLEREISSHPHILQPRYSLAQHYFLMRRWDELYALIEKTNHIKEISLPDRANISVLELLAHYVNGTIKDLSVYHALSPHLATGYAKQPDQFTASVTFYKYVLRLLQFQHENPAFYSTGGSEEVHVVGDSHTLSAHGLPLAKEICKEHLLIGTTAHNLKNEGKHRSHAYLKLTMDNIPPDETVVMMVGEIDCRVEYGIVPFVIKTGSPLQEVAEKTAREYVEGLSGAKQRLFLTTVPPIAPARLLRAKDKDADFRAALIMVRDAIIYFNSALRAACKKHGYGVVDIYHEALGSNGLAKPDTHIDDIHIYPHILKQAIERAVYP